MTWAKIEARLDNNKITNLEEEEKEQGKKRRRKNRNGEKKRLKKKNTKIKDEINNTNYQQY